MLKRLESKLGFKGEVLWFNVFLAVAHHCVGAVWCYHYAFPAKWQTVAFAVFMYVHSGLGLTAGAHRYWSHRMYKATLPLQILLVYLWSSAGMYKIRFWALQHRMHHKFCDTPADPHDITRGRVFAHIGCVLLKHVPEVHRSEKVTDMSDLDNDKVVQFADRYFIVLQILCAFVLPTAFGAWLCAEDWRCVAAWQVFIRYLAVFHVQMTVNSILHTMGTQHFDNKITARDNLFVVLTSGGEGFHNYHHVFPFDYKGADYPVRSITTVFINFFAKIGWAYDLREASQKVIKAHQKKMGYYAEEQDHWIR